MKTTSGSWWAALSWFMRSACSSGNFCITFFLILLMMEVNLIQFSLQFVIDQKKYIYIKKRKDRRKGGRRNIDKKRWHEIYQ